MNRWKLKAAISVGAGLAIAVRMIWPNLKFDSITLGLVIVGILPWLSDLIESAKFPGGWEVKFRTIQAAGQKVTEGVSRGGTRPTQPAFVSVADQDPNLALVGLRIEIEKKVRELALRRGVQDDRSLTRLIRTLADLEALPRDVMGGLQEIVMAGNRAAHGAQVEPSVGEWAFNEGPRILAALDSHLQS